MFFVCFRHSPHCASKSHAISLSLYLPLFLLYTLLKLIRRNYMHYHRTAAHCFALRCVALEPAFFLLPSSRWNFHTSFCSIANNTCQFTFTINALKTYLNYCFVLFITLTLTNTNTPTHIHTHICLLNALII